ncbi:MAG: FUSC family protein [Burkholderiaceae bacterium]|nr:FUSC family protein [Burkholderiaceae bacterium]
MLSAIRKIPAWAINGISVTLGLCLAYFSCEIYFGNQAALPLLGGAICVSLSDVVTTVDRVARRVAAASAASIGVTLAYVFFRSESALTVLLVASLIFGAMLIHSWGIKAGTVSFAAVLSLIFMMSAPAQKPIPPSVVAWSICGMLLYWLWAVGTSWLLQSTWRRLALAQAFEEVSLLIAARGKSRLSEISLNSTRDLNQLELAIADHLQSARDLIFGNADGSLAHLETTILLRLIDLRDHTMNAQLEAALLKLGSEGRAAAEFLWDFSSQVSCCVREIADHVRMRKTCEFRLKINRLPDDVFNLFGHDLNDAERDFVLIATRFINHQIEQLQLIESILSPNWSAELPCRRSDLRRYIFPDEWRLSAVGANLSRNSPILRHAIRTAVAAGLGYAASRALPWTPHPQWVVLSIAVVMQVNLAQTLARRDARVAGTLIGCLVVGLIVQVESPFFHVACILFAAGIAHAFLGVRYWVTAAAATVMAVLQAHILFPSGGFSIMERFGDTLFGALVGWMATFTLPNWEKKHMPHDVKTAVEAIRLYAAEVIRIGDAGPALPRFARQRAYDALRVIVSSKFRSAYEPTRVRPPHVEIFGMVDSATEVMSHLSSWRLLLTLRGQESFSPAFEGAVRALARRLDRLLQFERSKERSDSEMNESIESEFENMPGFSSLARRTLDGTVTFVERAQNVIGALERNA